jgi:hypothetical protein
LECASSVPPTVIVNVADAVPEPDADVANVAVPQPTEDGDARLPNVKVGRIRVITSFVCKYVFSLKL